MTIRSTTASMAYTIFRTGRTTSSASLMGLKSISGTYRECIRIINVTRDIILSELEKELRSQKDNLLLTDSTPDGESLHLGAG